MTSWRIDHTGADRRPSPRSLRALLSAAVATLALPASLWGQPLLGTETSGYLDFRSGSPGAPVVTGTGIVTGPYLAAFGSNATTAASASPLNIYCFDWKGTAGDGWVRIYTLEQALTLTTQVAIDFRAKMMNAPGGTNSDALNTTTTELGADLRSAAWLTTQMIAGPASRWDEQHVALWGLFWRAGAQSPTLPNFSTYANTGGSTTTAADWNSQALANNGFDASGFRIFVPVTITNSVETFDASRQIFLTQTVPEPGTWALMMIGLGAMGAMARRQARRQKQ